MDFGKIISEYGINGLGALMTEEEFMGAIQKNPQNARTLLKTIKRPVSTAGTAGKVNPSSRDEMIQRFDKLHPELRAGLASGALQLCDTGLLVIKSISGATSVDMLKADDAISEGYCMICQAKLPKNEPMLLTGITLQYGAHASAVVDTAAEAGAVTFGVLSDAVRNGQFEFKCGNKVLIPKMSLERFCGNFSKVDTTATASYAYAFPSGHELGYWKLDNPKLIESQTDMEFEIKWGLAAATYGTLKLILWGTKVFKN